MATLEIGGEFYLSPSLPISAQECANFYANTPQTTSPTQKNLFIPAGITEATTAGTSVTNRGGHVFQGVPYVVYGEDLYRITRTISGGGVTTYASVQVNGAVPLPGTQRVMMADNGAEGDQLCIILPEGTNKFNAYIFTETTDVLVQISDVDFDGPVSTIRYVDGFFLFTKSDSQKLFNSQLRNGLSYIATDFVLAEADPDNITGMWILNNEPNVFGTQTSEPFQNIGGAGFPWQRVQGGVQDKGLKSKFAIEEMNDIMIFLGADEKETPSIYVSEGGRPEKISTIAIDNELAKFSDSVIASCFTWKYAQSGGQFVGFTFPGRVTFVYDFTTGLFHTRESLNDAGALVPYRVSSVMDAYGVLLVGDSVSNKIGILDKDVFTEYGETIRRRFVTPQFDNEGDPFWIDALELYGEPGVGLTSGQGSDPEVLMSFSSNGGRTFSDRISRKAGKLGEYDKRMIWNSLGRIPREVCFKFEVSDPVKWTFSKVEARF